MVHAIPTLPRVPTRVPTRPSPKAPAILRAMRAAFRTVGPWAPAFMANVARRIYFSPRRLPGSPRDAQWLVGADQVWVETRRGRVAAYVWPYGGMFPWEGERDRGTVLLVHGWEGRGAQLGAFVGPLRDAGYRVIAFDAPAHGLSPGERADILEFSAAIEGVVEHFGAIDAVIAHSMGVPSVAVAIARGVELGRVVLIGGPSRFESVTHRFARELAMPKVTEALFRRGIEAHFGEDVWERFDAASLTTENPPPALVLHDVDDRMVHFSEAEYLTAHWPNARLVATAGLGHHRILHDQPVRDAVIDFVTHERTNHLALV